MRHVELSNIHEAKSGLLYAVLHSRWLIFYLLHAAIFFDAGYGVLAYLGLDAARISLAYRLSVVVLLFVYLFNSSRLANLYLYLLVSIWLINLCYWMSSTGFVSLSLAIPPFLELVYIFGQVALVSHLLISGIATQKQLVTGIALYGLVASCLFIFSFATGIGFQSYGDWAFGIKSFFFSGNEIGLSLLLILVLVWASFIQNGSLFELVLIALISLALLLIGTKAGWGGMLMAHIVFGGLFVFFSRARGFSTYMAKFIFISAIIGMSYVVAVYLEENFDQVAFQMQRIEEFAEHLNPRRELSVIVFDVFESYQAWDYLFGRGPEFGQIVGSDFMARYRSEDTLFYKAAEQDIFDLFGMYGLPITVLVFSYHSYFLLMAIKLYFSKPSISSFALFTGVFIYIFHAIFAGHAFISAQVGTCISVFYGLVLFNTRSKHQGADRHNLREY